MLLKCQCRLILLIIATHSIEVTYAQKHRSDYITTDSIYSQGRVFPMGRNKIRFQKTKLEQLKTYTSEEINEYGSGGSTFESLFIKGERSFYERIVQGENSLYLDRRSFILKRSDSLIQLNRGNFKSVLPQILDLEDQTIAKLSYTKLSMANFIAARNKRKYNSSFLPFRKAGAFVSYNNLNFNLSGQGFSEISDRSDFISFGFFADFPLYDPQSLNVFAELNWINAKPDFYSISENITNYLAIDVIGLTAPIGIKWIFNRAKLNPFLKAGALISYLQVNSQNGVIQTITTGSVVEIYKKEIEPANDLMLGYHTGIGMEIPIHARKNIHIEMKYIKSFKGDFDVMSFGFSGLYFNLGFNL